MMETPIRRAFDRFLKHSRACTFGMAIALSGAFLMPAAPVAFGQNYQSIPFSAEMGQEASRKVALDAKRSLLTGSSTEYGGDAGQKAGQYYSGFLVPAMTNAAFAERARKEIFTDIKTAKSQEMRDLIIRSVEGPLKTVVDNDTLAPSSRVAALILLGELDTEQADFTANKPPKPYPRTIAFLRTQLKKPNQLDGLLAAALVGLNRQIRYSSYTWQPAAKDAIADDLKLVLNAPKPLARSAEAHAYLQRMVVEGLSYFNSSKHPEIMNQLVTMLADDKQPTLLRVAISRALPRWPLENLTADQRKQVLAGDVQLVRSELAKWLEQARDPRRNNASGMGGMMGGMGGMGPMGGGMGPMGMGGDGDDGSEGLIGGGGGGRGAAMGMGSGGMGGMAPMGGGIGGPAGGNANKDKNLAETQDRATNAARRKLYTVLESVYIGLNGKAYALDRRPVGKGLDGYYPENDALAEPTKKILAEIDALYDALGEKSVTDMRTLVNALESPIDKFNLVADKVPGIEIYKKEELKKPAEAEVAGEGAPGAGIPAAGAGAPANPGDVSAPNNPNVAGGAPGAPAAPAAPGAPAPAPNTPAPAPGGAAAPGAPAVPGAPAAPGAPEAPGGAPAAGGN